MGAEGAPSAGPPRALGSVVIAASDRALIRACEDEARRCGLRLLGVADTPDSAARLLANGADLLVVEHWLAGRLAVQQSDGAAATIRLVLVAVGPQDLVCSRISGCRADGLLFGPPRPASLARVVAMARFGHAVLPSAMVPWLSQGEERLKRLAGLAPVEHRTLAQLAHGRPNRDIAAALGVTEAVVKAAIRGILSKLSLRNRTQAAVFASGLYDDAASALH